MTAPFAPLPPATYGGAVRAEQILTLSAGERSSTLQTYVDVTPQKISVVGTTALAQRVLSFSLDDAGLHVEAAEGGIDAQQVLTDLQLATWPLAALQKAVAGSDWRISDPKPGVRRVLRGSEPYAEARYGGKAPPWDGRIWLVNFPYRYTLDIESHPLP
jgi:hypothetical protein